MEPSPKRINSPPSPRHGRARDKILIENASTNTGENIILTRKLLPSRDRHPQRFIVVQKPYMERRSFATFQQVVARTPA